MTAQYDALRYDLDTDAATMDDTEIATLYVRSDAIYGAGTGASEAWARVLAVRKLKAGAAKRVDYKQNQSQEWLSQLYKNLELLEKQFMGDLDVALGSMNSAVRFGGLRRFQPRLVEMPDDQATTFDGEDVSRLEPR